MSTKPVTKAGTGATPQYTSRNPAYFEGPYDPTILNRIARLLARSIARDMFATVAAGGEP